MSPRLGPRSVRPPSLGRVQRNMSGALVQFAPPWPPRCSLKTYIWAASVGRSSQVCQGRAKRVRVAHTSGAPYLALYLPKLQSRPSPPSCLTCDLSGVSRDSQLTRVGCAWFPSVSRDSVGLRSRSSSEPGGRDPPWHTGWPWVSP